MSCSMSGNSTDNCSVASEMSMSASSKMRNQFRIWEAIVGYVIRQCETKPLTWVTCCGYWDGDRSEYGQGLCSVEIWETKLIDQIWEMSVGHAIR